jgi:hypothetical protein
MPLNQYDIRRLEQHSKLGKEMIYVGEVSSRRNLLTIGIEFRAANFCNVLQYLLLEVLLKES